MIRQTVHFLKADPAYGGGVAHLLGLNSSQIAALADLQLKALFQATSEECYRKVDSLSALTS